MRRLSVMICSGLIIVSSNAVVQATLFFDFEPATYSLGTLAGQDGWSGGGSNAVVENTVVLSGSQSVQLTSNAAATHSTTGAGFADLSTVSLLARYSNNSSSYAEFTLAGAVPYVTIGLERNAVSDFYWYDGGTIEFLAGGSGATTYLVTISLDFPNQQFSVVFDDGINPAFSSGIQSFRNPTTVAQAESGFLRLSGGISGRQATFDNISVSPIPEPNTITMMITSFIGMFAVRRRRVKIVSIENP